MIFKLIFAMMFGYNGDSIEIECPFSYSDECYILREFHKDSIPGDEVSRVVNLISGYEYKPEYYREYQISKLEAFFWSVLIANKVECDRLRKKYQKQI